ncbi:uncharacterized protein JCM10292_000763 [Rhodotorula paludigena]|uniref:uncharacterized protein n=1 Tax=Rhodotorula paludigena TaxID=86838 RepID=UPI0031775E4B
MAKGLFAVYRDDTAGPSALAGSTRSSAAPPNKASARRKDGLSSREGSARGLGLREKENIDPLAPRWGGKDALGKGKKPMLAAKKGGDEACGRTAQPRGLGMVPRGMQASQAICTGTLRTRVLPDLPPLSPPAPSPAEVERITPIPPSFAAPSTLDVFHDAHSAPASPRLSGEGSFVSASDSGYARSSSGRASDTDLDADVAAAAFADETDADTSLEVEAPVELSDHEANRRARALTESPLAEITQAFTGLGNFAVAHMSPTPSHTRPSARSTSPSKAPSASTLPARSLPYSTTATTKRVKPGQSVPSALRTAPGPRSLRF